MNESLEKIIKSASEKLNSNIYKPTFFNLQLQQDSEALQWLLEDASVQLTDTIDSQLAELVAIKNPSIKLSSDEIQVKINLHLNGTSLTEYGVWVYYPWNKHIVHLLNEEEFLEVRTNRNKHKITDREQRILKTKKVGVIGMSVGQTIASVLAIESLCSEIRIADFDILELTNCNRIKTSLKHLGLSKSIIAAREIAEIDPFINVVCYNNGVSEENIDAFFNEGGKLDLLLEECDSIDIKLLAREAAKKYRIPIVMETNDRGMIDIERYDLDENYLPFHGMLGNTTYQQLKQISSQEKVGYILKIVGALSTSVRSRASFLELGQSIINFPQLASSVYLGGAICADTVRRIFLDQFNASGRYYVDVENIITDKEHSATLFNPHIPEPISANEMQALADKHSNEQSHITISEDVANEIIKSAAHAPSSGNDQPWVWLYHNNSFFLFHYVTRSYSFGDFNNRASYISLGSAIENFDLSAQHHSYKTNIQLFPDKNDERLVAKIDLAPVEKNDNNSNENLYQNILKRHTNRKVLPRKIISEDVLHELKREAETVKGVNVDWITDITQLTAIGKIISACDRMRLLNLHGHYDFFNREIRWNNDELAAKKTGMGIDDLAIPNESLIALKFLSDAKVAEVLSDINGANALRNVSVLNTMAASAMCLITVPDYSPNSFIAGGRAMEKQWLKATDLSVAYHPMVAPLYFFPRIIFGDGEGLNETTIAELKELRKQFLEIFPGDNLRGEIALIRIFTPDEGEPKAPRLNLKDVFIYNK